MSTLRLYRHMALQAAGTRGWQARLPSQAKTFQNAFGLVVTGRQTVEKCYVLRKCVLKGSVRLGIFRPSKNLRLGEHATHMKYNPVDAVLFCAKEHIVCTKQRSMLCHTMRWSDCFYLFVTSLSLPTDDLGRMNKRRNADF